MNCAVQQAEEAITQAMIDGSLPNERLQATLRELDDGRYVMPLTMLRQAMARSGARAVADGLVAILGDLHRRGKAQVAEAQILAIGFYRIIWRLLTRLDPDLPFDSVRQLSAAQAAQVCYGFTFGMQPSPFPLPPALCARLHTRMQAFMRRADLDHEWREQRPLPLATPVVTMGDRRLMPAQNAIRTHVLAETFTRALVDDPLPGAGDLVIADLLCAADERPATVGFLRDVAPAQARFRLRQITLAVIALHHQAAGHGSAAGVLHRETIIACLLSPFVSLRSWLRLNREGLFIPLVQETLAGDPIIITPGPAASESTLPLPLRPDPPMPPGLGRRALA